MANEVAAERPSGLRVFVSYAWEDDAFRDQVKGLAARLRDDGVDARLDAWHLEGLSIPEFMSREIRHADKILILCSPEYRRKVHAMEDRERISGVGWEIMLVTSAIWAGSFPREKVEVALLRGERAEAIPDFLQGVPSIDLSDQDRFEANYLELLRRLVGHREPPPPIGHLPPAIEAATVEPLRGKETRDHTLISPGRVLQKLPFPTLAELFVGRDEEIATLDRHFRCGGAAATKQPVALIGGGGVGKTRLALEYAFRHSNDFTASLFVSANTPDDLNTNMARLCAPDALNLPENQSPSQVEQRDAVIRWLQQHRNWLFIVDNVDTDEAVASVQSLLASLAAGQIIITTRITDWGGCAHEFTLDVIAGKDAAQLLLRSTVNRRVTHDDDTMQAQTLAERLGCLPLMLTHASAYIRRYRESIAGYLAAFEKKLPEVLAWHDHNAIKYETDPAKDRVLKTVATTYFMSFDRLGAVEKALLRGAGLLAPNPIPVAMFEQSRAEVLALVKLWCEETGEPLPDKSIRDALADLAHVSLITQTDGAFEIHRVEQRILDSRVLPPWRDKWAQAVVNMVQAYVPSNSSDPMAWPIWYRLRPHAEFLWEQYENAPGVLVSVGLPESIANYFFGKGLDSRGIPYAEKVVAFYETHNDKDDPTLLSSLHLLGYLYENNEEYTKAEPMYRRELDGWEHRQGPLGEGTLATVNRLACLLGLKRDYENAESLFRRAIEGREKVLGLDDPETLKSKQDLGWMFHRKGDIAAAEPFFRGALPGLERSLGVDHRDTLACAHNLALVLEHKGELDEAEKLWQRAVVGSLKQLGAIHRTTVLYVNSLGSLLLKKGDKEKALKLQLDSVLEREKEPESGGDKQLPIDLNNLGLEFRKVGKLDVAEQLLRRALAKDQAIRGQSHPKIPHRLNNLCSALIMQGKLNEAKPLLARAWQMKSGKHDLTSTRLLFVRLTVALLESQSSEQILGMLKTMVAWESMPDHAEVVTTWDMAYFIEYLRPKLPLGSAEFLTALAAALNDHDEVGKLDSFDLWKNSSPIPLDIPWPE